MNLQIVLAGLLVLAALLGSWRTWRVGARWRVLRIIGQFAVSLALYFVIFPPMTPRVAEARVVLTPGVTADQIQSRDRSFAAIALPGVVIDEKDIEQVPDLATALRRHPQIDRLQILGAGLPARDRDIANHIGIAFDPAPLPSGIVELHAPASVMAGALWSVSGRLESIGGTMRIELHDRADALLGTANMDDSGHFTLRTSVASAARSIYRLRVLGADDGIVEEVPLAVDVHEAEPVQLTLIAGAPDAELKYLRRWATDADIAVASRMQLSRGINLRERDVALDASALAKADLLIVDERSWAQFDKSTRSAIKDAVGQGLGLLLRVTGPIPAAVASEWAEFGFRLESAELATSIALQALPDPKITRPAMKIVSTDSATLFEAADGSALARWRASGLGRIAIWLPLDTYRLALAGRPAEFGMLWSETFTTLARARGMQSPRLPRLSWIGERSLLCDLAADSHIENPEGERVDLIIESGCAAYWPSTAGWHSVVEANARWSFFVFAHDQARALALAQTMQATHALVRDAKLDAAVTAMTTAPRWPFFLTWIAVSTMLWWLERRRSLAGSS